jgi:hypothetical protein
MTNTLSTTVDKFWQTQFDNEIYYVILQRSKGKYEKNYNQIEKL